MKIGEIIRHFYKMTETDKQTNNEFRDIFSYKPSTGTWSHDFSYETTTYSMTDYTFFDNLIKYSEYDIDSFDIMKNAYGYDDMTTFFKILNVFTHNNQNQLERILNALTVAYSPVENVDEYTTETTEHTGTISDVNHGEGTSTDENITTEMAVPVCDQSTDVNNGSSTVNGTSTTEADSTLTKTFNNKDTLTVRRHGNIGVTESTALASHEILFRLSYNFIELVIKDFVKEWLFYAEGVE